MDQWRNLISQLMQAFDQSLSEGDEYSDEEYGMLAEVLQGVLNRIEQPSAPISGDAQLLWILSGAQPQAFVSYLRSFPTAATTQLVNNPYQLQHVIEQLSRQMPQGSPEIVDGIPHADLNSSNVWGSQYDPRTGKMRVRFQGGSEYEYDGVSPVIYDLFSKGNASAKTKGKNQYGQWWVGKNPSLGAALNQFIKKGGYPYRKVA